MSEERPEQHDRWSARPRTAALLRLSALLLPIAGSVIFVYLASQAVPPPADPTLASYLGWWLGLSGLTTLVLFAVGRLSRRLLPLAALLRLSLVFPDATPSRFRAAVSSATVRTLEERVGEAKRSDATPAEAARRLLALVSALDEHDGLTRGHSERVRAFSQLIGRELGLGEHDLDLLNWAALLHDIGKLDVPSEILNKRGRPTEEEWATIRSHPDLGMRLVAPLSGWLGDWGLAVGDHHERWDGGGYPRGIAGTEISLAGRIVAVADVFEVITSTRSYKQATTMSAARKEIVRCAGTQFDPEVVRAFLAVSLGRTRLAAGPGAWLAQAAVLARVPLSSAAGTLSAAAVVSTAVAPGVISGRGPLPTTDAGTRATPVVVPAPSAAAPTRSSPFPSPSSGPALATPPRPGSAAQRPSTPNRAGEQTGSEPPPQVEAPPSTPVPSPPPEETLSPPPKATPAPPAKGPDTATPSKTPPAPRAPAGSEAQASPPSPPAAPAPPPAPPAPTAPPVPSPPTPPEPPQPPRPPAPPVPPVPQAPPEPPVPPAPQAPPVPPAPKPPRPPEL